MNSQFQQYCSNRLPVASFHVSMQLYSVNCKASKLCDLFLCHDFSGCSIPWNVAVLEGHHVYIVLISCDSHWFPRGVLSNQNTVHANATQRPTLLLTNQSIMLIFWEDKELPKMPSWYQMQKFLQKDQEFCWLEKLEIQQTNQLKVIYQQLT